ncbi:MAG: hypothetical protein M3441_23605 [Chloroflexota bacterium]|nr:hypothetical protein [Chloroflexota bacterium]
MAETELLVDPAVSRAKFAREVAEYRKIEDDLLRRGWWMLRAEHPEVFVVFANPALKPPAVIFGALLDFSNYDLWAPSVKLVDPFTREPYKAKELPTVLKRRTVSQVPPEVAAMIQQQGGEVPEIVQDDPLMQWYTLEDEPFLCLPGIREYHEHPAHSGDSWLLHRDRGEGRLYFILEKLYKYGVQPIKTYNIQMMPVIRFGQQEAPE